MPLYSYSMRPHLVILVSVALCALVPSAHCRRRRTKLIKDSDIEELSQRSEAKDVAIADGKDSKDSDREARRKFYNEPILPEE